MKTKVFMAAVAMAFAFAVTSCGNKKAADAASTADSTAVEQVESAACCKQDSAACCKEKGEGCQKDSTACCKEKGAEGCEKACDKK